MIESFNVYSHKQFIKFLYKDGTEVATNVNKIISFNIKNGKEYGTTKPCKVVEFIVEGIQNFNVVLTDELRVFLGEISNDISLYNT